jgi:hypothetical protein
MRSYGPDDELDDVKIDWIEAGIFQKCLVKVADTKVPPFVTGKYPAGVADTLYVPGARFASV